MDNPSKKILFVIGTRPEAIKMIPLIKAFNGLRYYDTKVCVTAQHREMLDQVLTLFDIKPHYDLNSMRLNQSLADLTSRLILSIESVLIDMKPDLLFVHGDTTTTLSASLAAYYHRVDVAHIEAGLRTGNLYAPWPEEANRKMLGALSKYHFAPTEPARENLLNENVSETQIYVTGNTIVDALMSINAKLNNDPVLYRTIKSSFQFLDTSRKMILVTCHRRENIECGLERLCEALISLATDNNRIQIVFPYHLNPLNHLKIKKRLSGINNIYLLKPQSYLYFVYLMTQSYIILTDSGGIQEEAASLHKPTLVLRMVTERKESMMFKMKQLVGTDVSKIVTHVNELLYNDKLYRQLSSVNSPYGDGKATARIVNIINQLLLHQGLTKSHEG